MNNNRKHLPSELISKILHYLDDKADLYTCNLINKHFYNVIQPLLWRAPTIDSAATLTKLTSIIASPNKVGEHVRIVSFNFNLSRSALSTLIPHVPFLTDVQLENNSHHITDTQFRCVPRGCPHLTSLSLCSVGITISSLIAVGRYCRRLHTITLRSCPGLPDDPYQLFAEALRDCPLKSIDLLPSHVNPPDNSPAAKLSMMMINKDFAEALALVLFKTHPLIESLTLWNPYKDKTRFITTSNTQNLVWTHLTHLEIDGAHDLDDTQTLQFIEQHPQLTYISFGSTKITDCTLHAVPMLLPNMKRINLEDNHDITATGLCDLVKRYGGQLQDVVRCDGCSIFTTDADFPHDLNPACYEVVPRYTEEGGELIWLASNAFKDEEGES